MVKVLKSVPSGWRAPGNVSVRRTGLGWVGLPPQLERSPDSNSADPARTGRLMNERNMEGPFLRGAGARKVPSLSLFQAGPPPPGDLSLKCHRGRARGSA